MITDLLKYSLLIYSGLILFIIISIVILYLYGKFKRKKVYKYKGNKLKLVKNTLGVKKAIYFLFKTDFRKVIEEENKSLGFEYIKPFDITKLKEQNVLIADLMGALILISERKDLLPLIFNFLVEKNNVKYDFEKDFDKLSNLGLELLEDFFIGNLRKMLL
jgi:hypothetical protein